MNNRQYKMGQEFLDIQQETKMLSGYFCGGLEAVCGPHHRAAHPYSRRQIRAQRQDRGARHPRHSPREGNRP